LDNIVRFFRGEQAHHLVEQEAEGR